MHDFEIDRIVKIIKERDYRVIGLQLPEGLKDSATEIADAVMDKSGCDVVISADPCYGACDLADDSMERIGVDALFHFGHSPIISKTRIHVFYIETRSEADPIPLISKNLDKLPKKVGLVTTVQHVHALKKVKEFLEEKKFEVFIGKAKGRAKYDGQILGCNFSCAKSIAEKVDCLVYIGSGNFHPLGAALATGKKTFAFDIEMNEVRDLDFFREKILRQRFAKIARASDAKTFGIIICEKKGQRRKNLALRLKKKIEKHGKKAYLLYLDEISPEALFSFRRLTLVNTACPRVTIDDAARYKQPVLTPVELEIALGERKFENYEMDEMK
ncbi:MAG: diphthamide biosynthesis enzyme Dph2 [Candidatus Hydrothermarchaeota archaeon]|nr:diphthamide biosynthesis enzyme Dph2 [Candidatus Hydrothermarchaeota archaeon]